MYLHLLSNASNNVFPNNEMGDFSTILASPVTLSGDWEVGLSEINIPGSFLNIGKEDAWFRTVQFLPGARKIDDQVSKDALIRLKGIVNIYKIEPFNRIRLKSHYYIKVNGNILGLPEILYGDKKKIFLTQSPSEEFSGKFEIFEAATKEKKYEIESRHYTSIEEIIKEVNLKASNAFKLTLINGKVVCEFSEVCHVVQFSFQLASMLGFRHHSVQKHVNRAHFLPDMSPGFNAIMVYTDFIEESHVGDIQAPLLRLLPKLNVNSNESMSYECYPIQYKKILQHEISHIRIVLRDDTGRKLSFQDDGRVSLTLHVRKS